MPRRRRPRHDDAELVPFLAFSMHADAWHFDRPPRHNVDTPIPPGQPRAATAQVYIGVTGSRKQERDYITRHIIISQGSLLHFSSRHGHAALAFGHHNAETF